MRNSALCGEKGRHGGRRRKRYIKERQFWKGVSGGPGIGRDDLAGLKLAKDKS